MLCRSSGFRVRTKPAHGVLHGREDMVGADGSNQAGAASLDPGALV